MPDISEKDQMRQQIDAINQIAWEMRITDSARTFEIVNEAENLSRQNQYQNELANSLSVLGFGYIRISAFNLTIACIDEALAIYEPLNDIKGQALVYVFIGIIQRNKGNSSGVLQSIFEALKLGRQTSFNKTEVTNLYQIGVTFWQLANYDKALENLFKNLALPCLINFPLIEAYHLNVTGSIYFETPKYDQALNFYQQGLPVRKLAGDKWGEAGKVAEESKFIIQFLCR